MLYFIKRNIIIPYWSNKTILMFIQNVLELLRKLLHFLITIIAVGIKYKV